MLNINHLLEYNINRSLQRHIDKESSMLRVILSNMNISLYSLEKKSSISHSTLSDIYNEKINIDKCSILTIKNIASSLNMSIDELYEILSYKKLCYITFDREFDLYKSEICHEYKRLRDSNFLKKYLLNMEIENLINSKEYDKALYLLSFIDYICLKNNLPFVKKYEDIRKRKLNKLYVSESIFLLLKNKQINITKIFNECRKEFLIHNIVESEVENVI
ncbi:MAG: helix-turn-helix transcriptional regulator [Erysipelotrichaceae bacterium]|nr:helix-turn-helix transcriptional regulator [Erysipelotrichaceae bacterium]